MEIILTVTLILSLFGNFFQYNKVQKVKEDNKIITIAANKNHEAFLVAIEANKEYEYTVNNLESNVKSCNENLQSAIDKFDRWKDSELLKAYTLTNLEERLGDINYSSSCVVPAWVDFEAGDSGINRIGAGDN